MRITYRSPLPEIVEVHLRAIRNSKAASKMKIKGMAAVSVISAFWPVFMTREPVNARLFLSAFGFVTGASVYWFMYPGIVRRRTQKLIQESLGGADGADVEIRVNESGVWCVKGA